MDMDTQTYLLGERVVGLPDYSAKVNIWLADGLEGAFVSRDYIVNFVKGHLSVIEFCFTNPNAMPGCEIWY